MNMKEKEVRALTNLKDWAGLREVQTKVLFTYLSTYHSDMRWLIRILDVKDPDFNTINFKNTKMFYLDVNGVNILVYGAKN